MPLGKVKNESIIYTHLVKSCEMAKLLSVLSLAGFMFCACHCTEPPPSKPIIYVTFGRWENRTISPRLYYISMIQHSQTGVETITYAYETPPDVTKLDDNKIGGQILFRSRLTKPSQDPTTELKVNEAEEQSLIFRPENSTFEYSGLRDGITESNSEPVRLDEEGHFRIGSSVLNHTDPILFKDGGLTNRRKYPGPKSSSDPEWVFSCFSHGPTSSTKPSPRNVIPEQSQEQTIDTLGLSLRIAKTRGIPENFVFSPLSIVSILALLLLGSSGSTYNELARFLVSMEDRKDGNNTIKTELQFHQNLAHILYVLNNCTDPKILETANEVFSDSRFPVIKPYKEQASHLYGATPESFDFATEGGRFKDYVNQWVREKTKGKIKSIIDAPPSPLTSLVLVNAVYFQGNWEIPFLPQITRDALFHIDTNTTSVIKLMLNVMTIPYVETSGYRMIRLPYKNAATALHIVLPKKTGIDGLLEVEQHMNLTDLQSHLESMTPRVVTVRIPKMRLQSDGNLEDILSSLGLSIFAAQSADFTRISPTPGLHVSSMFHRAIIDINEKGTEAAAVSIATGDRNLDSNQIVFNVDRPFIFFIYDSFARTVLFWGRVVRPQPLDDL